MSRNSRRATSERRLSADFAMPRLFRSDELWFSTEADPDVGEEQMQKIVSSISVELGLVPGTFRITMTNDPARWPLQREASSPVLATDALPECLEQVELDGGAPFILSGARRDLVRKVMASIAVHLDARGPHSLIVSI